MSPGISKEKRTRSTGKYRSIRSGEADFYVGCAEPAHGSGVSATILKDGRVLVAGGFGRTNAEVLDPATMTSTPTGTMIQYQYAKGIPLRRVPQRFPAEALQSNLGAFRRFLSGADLGGSAHTKPSPWNSAFRLTARIYADSGEPRRAQMRVRPPESKT
jgi:hypothetical protein